MKIKFQWLVAISLILWALISNAGVVPSVGLYWQLASDPTVAPGIAAPLGQLLQRTDTPSIYYKSGAANTAWTLLGGGGAATFPDITDTAGVQVSINNSAAFNAKFALLASGTITPAALNGTSNNYNPAGLSTASRLRQDCSAASTLTGLTAQGDGQILTIYNITTTQANTLTLNHADAGSTASNRFLLPSDLAWIVPRDASVTLQYDGTSARWRMMSYSGNVFPVGNVSNPGIVIGTTLNRGFFDNAVAINSTNGGSSVATFSAGFGLTGALNQSGGQVTFNTGTSGLINTGPFSTSTVVLSTGVTAPANLTGGTTNDYSPANASTNTTFLQNVTAGSVVTGFNANTNTNGRIIIIQNTATAAGNTITFNNEDAGSTAANRFTLPSGVALILGAGSSITFRYDSTASRWRPIDR